MNKKLCVATIIFSVLLVVGISVFIATRPTTNENPKSVSDNNTDSDEPVTNPNTRWTTYRNPACDISYTIPPSWVSQGWATNSQIITLSSPDDMRQDEVNPRMTDAGPASPTISFYVSCMDETANIFDGQDKSLVQNGYTVEIALAKGLLKNLGDAQYLKTIEVAGQKAFVYEIGAADSRPGMHYDSVFVYLNDKWMEIRPSVTRFDNITQDQQRILDSIQVLNAK